MATTTVHAGSKRKPEDIGDQERLAKRFDLLNISMQEQSELFSTLINAPLDSHHKHYLPVTASDQSSPPAPPAPPQPTNGDYMEVEDTKDRVFIQDLDAELAEIESDEEPRIFIPEIDKHLNKLPQALLRGHDPRSQLNDKQLILYHSVPQSVSLTQDEDNVRKAIIESRNRARIENRTRIKKDQRGDMDVEDEPQQPKKVLAHLRWKDSQGNRRRHDGQRQPMDDEDGYDATFEESDEDAMDLG